MKNGDAVDVIISEWTKYFAAHYNPVPTDEKVDLRALAQIAVNVVVDWDKWRHDGM